MVECRMDWRGPTFLANPQAVVALVGEVCTVMVEVMSGGSSTPPGGNQFSRPSMRTADHRGLPLSYVWTARQSIYTVKPVSLPNLVDAVKCLLRLYSREDAPKIESPRMHV